MNDDQFKTLIKAIDNVANVLVIICWMMSLIGLVIVFFLTLHH